MQTITDRALEKLKGEHGKPFLVSVGSSVWLRVSANAKGETRKRWLTRFALDGKPRKKVIGGFPELSIAAAKVLARQMREPTAGSSGPLPAMLLNLAKALAKPAKAGASGATFADAAESWLERKNRDWSKSHAAKQRLRIDSYLVPALGAMPVGEIGMEDIARIVEKIISKGAPETARRVFRITRCILQHARKTGAIEDASIFVDLAAYGRDELAGARPGGHYYSGMSDREIGKLLLALENFRQHGPNAQACALCLAPYVFARPSELCGALWEEINLDEALWRIPAERMKMRREHLVPLSKQAVGILATLREKDTGPVFRNRRGARISPESLRAILRALGYGYKQNGFTTHSFRGLASTILHQELEYPPHLVELQLAHIEKNKVRAAYDRITPFSFLERRREMLQRYADHLDSLKRKADSRSNF